MDWLIDIINFIFEQIGNLGSTVTGMLPPSPLRWVIDIDVQWLSYVNWLIPIGEMVVIAEFWLTCIGIWYVVRIALHWAKVAGG